MKWQGGRNSGNVEDRRGMSGGQKLTLGGIGGVIVLIIGFLMGGDPTELLNQAQQQGGVATEPVRRMYGALFFAKMENHTR